MEIRFWSRGGLTLGSRPLIPRDGFVDAPEGTDRISITAHADRPQVWLLSLDGHREYCAWTEAAAWDHDHDGVRVLVVAEYSAGRVMARTFCAEHAQAWLDSLGDSDILATAAVHDMRYREDVPTT